MANKIIATNRKAYHNYHILKKYESGIVLLGSEFKSIRQGGISQVDGCWQQHERTGAVAQ